MAPMVSTGFRAVEYILAVAASETRRQTQAVLAADGAKQIPEHLLRALSQEDRDDAPADERCGYTRHAGIMCPAVGLEEAAGADAVVILGGLGEALMTLLILQRLSWPSAIRELHRQPPHWADVSLLCG